MLTFAFPRLCKTLVLVTLVAFAAFAAFAGDVADDFEHQVAPAADCIVGNINPPGMPPVEGIFQANEQYAYHIYPADQCDCVEGGFSLEAIHQLLDFTPDQIPAGFSVRASLMTAVLEVSTGCWVPDQTLFVSAPENFLVIDNGLFEVVVPTPSSGIYVLNAHYFLALSYDGLAEGQLVIDNQPMICTEYVNRGNGWEDLNLVAKSGGGKMIVWGDIVCGMPAVDIERGSFDAIKSLYR